MRTRKSRRRRTSGGRAAAPLALLAVVLSGCGGDGPALEVGSSDDVRTAPTSRPAPDASAGGAPSTPAAEQPAGSGAASEPAEEPHDGHSASHEPSAPGGSSSGPDLDGDGRADRVSLVAVPDMGWSFDVALADGRETSAPLPADLAVAEDVGVVGGVDLDADGRDEVLVRTLRAVGGQNAVVFRLDGDGVWLVRTPEGTAWELATTGGMSGPRSYDCFDAPQGPRREVRTRQAQRETGTDGASTYAATTVTWRLDGHGVTAVAEESATGVVPEQVALDPSTCTA